MVGAVVLNFNGSSNSRHITVKIHSFLGYWIVFTALLPFE